MDYTKSYLDTIKPLLKEKRYIHTLGVIDEAICYAKHYNVDINKARIAATLHDICKYFEYDKLKELVLRYEPLEYFNILPTATLHSYAAYSYCKDELKIDDEEILNAIKYHTVGRINMTLLEKIIYLADFSDPNRDMPYCKIIHDEAIKNIDKAMYHALKISLDDIITNHKEQSPLMEEKTKEILNYFKELSNEQ